MVAKFPFVTVVGGGLAGSEAAWQIAESGIQVNLYEMRPDISTGAHHTSNLAEIVCSNSFGSSLPDRASGMLKNELIRCNSLLMDCADRTSVPAGNALAVDRDKFSQSVTEKITTHPNIHLFREEVREIPSGPAIISTGPLTSQGFSQALSKLTGEDYLFFYDAVSPIVSFESINMEIAFRASRFDNDENKDGDYINCPLSKEEYENFVINLINAEIIALPEQTFDKPIKSSKLPVNFFEGCLPIEVLAKRGIKALAFGPMRPVGLKDPRTGKGVYAILQLRQDNIAGNLYNLVGFQTNLTYPEQRRVFRMIPGLEQAEFSRYGQMHRNTFIASPKLLLPTLQYRNRSDLFFAGQITGVEGYLGNIATGLLAGRNITRLIHGLSPIPFPRETMLGALCYYIAHADITIFQPMKANIGILPNLENSIKGKRDRAKVFAHRADCALTEFLNG